MSDQPTVHILWLGQPRCGFSPGVLPGHWPPGHRWCSPLEPQHATCRGCIRAHEEAKAEKRRARCPDCHAPINAHGACSATWRGGP